MEYVFTYYCNIANTYSGKERRRKLKNRKEIYEQEGAELLRVISAYKTLDIEQIYALFPNKKQKIEQILKLFIKQGRCSYDATYGLLYYGQECKVEKTVITCFWVLLDFIENIQYHLPADYPSVISFFAKEEIYEIAYVAEGQEIFIQYAFSVQGNKAMSKRIIVVEQEEQIAKCNIPDTVGFCMVSAAGEVSYYQLK